MLNSDAVSRVLSRPPEGVSRDESTKSSGVRRSSASRLLELKLTDAQLALVLGAALFLIGAWPLALTEVPPYQDLPNHLAALTVIENPKAYPEFVFNGFFKTNAALFTWLHFVGKAVGGMLAARLFAIMTLALNAFVIPRFVLRFTGSRQRMVMASLFAWPMIHNWFVSMGMLDFAVAVPLSLGMLLAIDKQRTAPTVANGAAIIGLGVATWYAHVFPLLVVHLLLFIEAAIQPTWRARWTSARAMATPLVPVSLLAMMSVADQIRDTVGPMTGFMNFKKLLAPWELAYNLWAEWFWAYSNLSLSSIVPCVALAVVGYLGLRRRTGPAPRFFSTTAIVVMLLLYAFIPYKMTNWFHVNSRMIPYIWVAFLLAVPPRLPKALVGVLALSGVLYTAGMGYDYVRLDAERREFTAGIEAVPENAKLLPLLFKHKGASDNTRNLLHMWGYYVVAKKTSAPLLFAHSRSFPVTYSEAPPVRFNHLVLESFAPEMSSPATVCRIASRFDDCEGLFKSTWQKFYAEALPRYDHLLLWEATPEALAMIPSDYERTFSRGRLMIYARRDTTNVEAKK